VSTAMIRPGQRAKPPDRFPLAALRLGHNHRLLAFEDSQAGTWQLAAWLAAFMFCLAGRGGPGEYSRRSPLPAFPRSWAFEPGDALKEPVTEPALRAASRPEKVGQGNRAWIRARFQAPAFDQAGIDQGAADPHPAPSWR